LRVQVFELKLVRSIDPSTDPAAPCRDAVARRFAAVQEEDDGVVVGIGG
jgi:hypothetical protein